MSKQVHTYVFSNKYRMNDFYDRIRYGLIDAGEGIVREIKKGSNGDYFETDDMKFLFLVGTGMNNYKGRRTHYLFVESVFKDTELAHEAILPMLNGTGSETTKERLYWI